MIVFNETKRDKLQFEIDISVGKRDDCLRDIEAIESTYNAIYATEMDKFNSDMEERERVKRETGRVPCVKAPARPTDRPRSEPDGQGLPHNAHRQQGVELVVLRPGNHHRRLYAHHRGFCQPEHQRLG
jgi:hypothetical protein